MPEFELRSLHLLLYTHINGSGNILYQSFDAVSDTIHRAEVCTENLNRYRGSRAAHHVVDTVTQRLTDSSGNSRHIGKFGAHIVKHFIATSSVKFELHIYLRAVGGLRMFIKFTSTCSSGSRRHFGHFHKLALHHLP